MTVPTRIDRINKAIAIGRANTAALWLDVFFFIRETKKMVPTHTRPKRSQAIPGGRADGYKVCGNVKSISNLSQNA